MDMDRLSRGDNRYSQSNSITGTMIIMYLVFTMRAPTKTLDLGWGFKTAILRAKSLD
jgi:hypothetical protein